MKVICIVFMYVLFAVNIEGQNTLTTSNLPIILIQTNGQWIPDDPKIDARMKIIDNGGLNHINDIANGYDGNIAIETRGSTSQWFPKKPYGFETKDDTGEDVDVKLLGMPKENDWILNATYNDKSLMRDGLALILAGKIMEYAPRVRYNELVIDDEYQGVYLLIEKIKRDKNRVDIAKLESNIASGDALTGGYIVKLDKMTGSNSSNGWQSIYPPYPNASQTTYFQVDYPKADQLTLEQKNYIKTHVDLVEANIAGNNYTDAVNGFRKYIDEKSLMDYIIINELTKNPDAYRLSSYFYKERDSDGGKIKFGPVWDFNLGFGNVDYCTNGDANDLVINNFNQVCGDDGWVIHFWYERFLKDKQFYQDLKKRWATLRGQEFSNQKIHGLIDSLQQLLDKAQQRNFNKWPILSEYVWPNYYVGGSYQAEVDYLKNWIDRRLQFLDKEWSSVDSIQEETSLIGVTIEPNPAVNLVVIKFKEKLPRDLKIRFYSADGAMLISKLVKTTESDIQVDVQEWPRGMTMIHLESNGEIEVHKFMKQ